MPLEPFFHHFPEIGKQENGASLTIGGSPCCRKAYMRSSSSTARNAVATAAGLRCKWRASATAS